MSEASPGARLDGRLVVVGVTGSIAAYKAAELVRALTGAGAEVQVLLTKSAARFVGPLTFETITRRRVMLDPLELLPDRRIGHIVAADTADAIVVAPATARWLGAMANGLADDVVTATCLASGAPVVVAPAMDGEMWSHPATRANVERLRSFGYAIVEPEVGPLASGAVGEGRLAPVARIAAAVESALAERPVRQPDPALRPPRDESLREPDLEGRHVLVTAGGTAEPIDPVRFVGNRSSGRMGVAIAEGALARGARVTLVVGTTSVPLPEGARVVEAVTAAQMRRAVLEALPAADALVMAAAVADFRPRRAATSKLTRADGLTLELEPTEDILAEASALAATMRPRPIVVGFAAETGSLERAVEKAERKGVDLLAANDVSEAGSGFGSPTNRITLIVPGEAPDPWPLLPKPEVAQRLLDRVAALLMLRDAVPVDAS
ncbi:MAG TPA: bifunctional phosphopantothenoylcysteine decarboxylase/phosphopantothenate--cysteine ligase CoaBC [Candidatus Limnocylindrales bacterium]|nr:bifunctional phosphopantothenoylcysteine decarboxylase/phosphopantothenate--cysteine ligase CoaBC [Candidatus Limnocylindrales bacterium]